MARASVSPSVKTWYAGEVTRPDAGNLWNAVHWEGETRIEAPRTPTHSRELAEQYADELNAAERAKS